MAVGGDGQGDVLPDRVRCIVEFNSLGEGAERHGQAAFVAGRAALGGVHLRTRRYRPSSLALASSN